MTRRLTSVSLRQCHEKSRTFVMRKLISHYVPISANQSQSAQASLRSLRLCMVASDESSWTWRKRMRQTWKQLHGVICRWWVSDLSAASRRWQPCFPIPFIPLEVHFQNNHGNRDPHLLDAHALQIPDFPLRKANQLPSFLQFFKRNGDHHWIIGRANHVNNAFRF